MQFKRSLIAAACSALIVLAATSANAVEDDKKFSLAWSIYVGYMPWSFMDESGIMDKWADK